MVGPLVGALASMLVFSALAGAQENLVRNPGFEVGEGNAPQGWHGTQNAGQAEFGRSQEQPHSGEWCGRLGCRAGDAYSRCVHARADLFASVQCRDRLRLSFRYRSTAALGDALVQVNTDAAPGWRQYALAPLRDTGGQWVAYVAELTVDVTPNGSGEVQLRGSTATTGEQVVCFDDVSLQVVGRRPPPGPRPFPQTRGDRPMLVPSELRVIETDVNQPPLDTAARDLQAFLESRLEGHTVSIRPLSEGPAAPSPGTVVIRTADMLPPLSGWVNDRRMLVELSPRHDAYSVCALSGALVLVGGNPTGRAVRNLPAGGPAGPGWRRSG